MFLPLITILTIYLKFFWFQGMALLKLLVQNKSKIVFKVNIKISSNNHRRHLSQDHKIDLFLYRSIFKYNKINANLVQPT